MSNGLVTALIVLTVFLWFVFCGLADLWIGRRR